ncbi:NfrA family protein [Photobacterium atrarenae]|uniref:Bacteriophage N4 adsorption protein A C-terminal domain-containing protein n=1 Tax=Photobacterium atrarenae TaxID=865757 RepID=A0ABY5GC17_9GAMM|nr:hypothetical protein [Photobacterium atrarenae]UTV26639.1 hypothetical protein NNL38_09710 [Photobacterium atrarenae]
MLLVFCQASGGSLVWAAEPAGDIYQGLTEYQQFRTYPYIDKAFRKEQQQDYDAALAEVNRALKLLPEHVPFLKYAYTLSVKAGRPEEELEHLVIRIPAEQRDDLLLDLRLKASENAQLYAPFELETMTQGLSDAQIQQWYLTHLYAIESRKGATAALNWSLKQPERFKSAEARRFEAYTLYQLHRYPQAVVILEPLVEQQPVRDKDLEYLAQMYMSLGQAAAFRQTVARIPDDGVKKRLWESYVDELLSTNRLAEAKTVLNTLAQAGLLTDRHREQRARLNMLSTAQLQQITEERRVLSPCMKEAMRLAQAHEDERGRVVLAQCPVEDNPVKWLALAESLGAYSLLAEQSFQSPELARKRRAVLVKHYQQQGEWRRVIALLRHSRREGDRKVLAEAMRQVGMGEDAAKILFELYQRTRNVAYLDAATYTLSTLSEPQPARQAAMFTEGMRLTPKAFLKHANLVNRAATLAYQNVAWFTVSQIDLLNTALAESAKVGPYKWQVQGKCNALTPQDRYATARFARRVVAYCLVAEQPEAAAKLYAATLSETPSLAESTIVARWYAQAQAYRQSYPYWRNMNAAVLSEGDRYLYIRTLYEVGEFELAELYWRNTDFEQDNPYWWLLGLNLAAELNDQRVFDTRLKLAFYRAPSPQVARQLAERYLATGDTQALRVLTATVVEKDAADQRGEMSATLGYLLAPTSPLLAEKLFRQAVQVEPYRTDLTLKSEYARVAAENGRKVRAAELYAENIDQLAANATLEVGQRQQLDYFRRAHRDLEQGWKFTVAGWVGESNGQAVPGYSDVTGDFFLYEEARYYLDETWLPRSALSLAGLHSGQYRSGNGSEATHELDLGFVYQPLKNWNYYLKAGLKQSFSGGGSQTRPYVRFSADVFSRDAWSKSWKLGQAHWLYQNLYLDGLYYLNRDDGHALYGRYELGQTFKIAVRHRQLLTPYGFGQRSENESKLARQQDSRVGLGASWRWEWYPSHYDGYDVVSEVGLEWQHILDSDALEDTGNAVLLRFSSFF